MTVKFPPDYFAAFNPAIIEIKKDDNDKDDEVSVRVRVYIEDSDATRTVEVTLNREFLNNEMKFDISNVIRKLFKDSTVFINKDRGILKDNNLCLEYELSVGNDDDGGGFALNAVSQLGESSDLTQQRGTFRTNFERIHFYPGYPRAIAILGFAGGTYVDFENDEIYIGKLTENFFLCNIKPDIKYISISNEGKYPDITTNSGEVITDNDGNIIYVYNNGYEGVYKYIETHPVPSSPFYVRWINQQGGYDYWMFSFRQIINRNIRNQQFFNPTVFDQKDAAAFTEEYYKEGVEKITVGADGLNENEYNCVSKLIYSPKIDYYDKKKDKWIRLIVDNGESENDTRLPGKNLEFTFLLPTPQLQNS